MRGLEPYVDKKELARLLAVTTRWCEYRLDEGMPSCIIGGRRKFRLSKVIPWLREHGHFVDDDAA